MKEYYKAYDKRYKQVHDLGLAWSNDGRTILVEEMINKYNIDKFSPILEIGCGEGRDARYLLDNGYNLIASDVSNEAIDFCKNKDSNHKNNYIVLDALKDKLISKYKFIYSVACLHMFVLDEDRNNFYKFIYNHLEEDGLALILSMGNGRDEYTSNIDDAYNDSKRIHQSTGKEIEVASTSCRIVSFDTLKKEIVDNRFKIIEFGVTEIDNNFNEIIYIVISK